VAFEEEDRSRETEEDGAMVDMSEGEEVGGVTNATNAGDDATQNGLAYDVLELALDAACGRQSFSTLTLVCFGATLLGGSVKNEDEDELVDRADVEEGTREGSVLTEYACESPDGGEMDIASAAAILAASSRNACLLPTQSRKKSVVSEGSECVPNTEQQARISSLARLMSTHVRGDEGGAGQDAWKSNLAVQCILAEWRWAEAVTECPR
jgi:hypothetical protein